MGAAGGLPLAQPVAVMGLGVTGRATARYLLAHGIAPLLLDRPEVTAAVAQELGRPDLPRAEILPQAVEELAPSTVFVTPGLPKHHPAVEAARRLGAEVTGEIPYVLQALRRAGVRVAGVTGSAGKTTTVSLVAAMLGNLPGEGFVGGNLGRPPIGQLDLLCAAAARGEPAWALLELSSFQLDLARASPHVAALLNLAPNHLDVHPSFEDYRRAKLEILRHQGPEDAAVLPAEPALPEAEGCGPARRYRFGLAPFAGDGFALVDGWLAELAGGTVVRRLIPEAEVRLPGRHNLRNVLAACAVARLMGAEPEAMAEAVRTFRGIPHRLERVAVVDGVTWVDDSIATSPDRTLAALEAVQGPVVLLAGGSDKGLDYTPLGPALRQRVRVLIVTGPTGPAIAEASRRAGGPVAQTAESLEEAVALARRQARPGETVLLAPASASFDRFTSYAERGDRFKALVQALARGAPPG